MTKEEPSQPGPKMVVIDTLVDSDIEVCDNKTFKVIEKCIVDFSKPREFDCLFMSANKSSAKELCLNLRDNLGYITEEPYQDENGWISHAVKQILYADLKDTLKTARVEAAKHSSKLFDWNIDVDKVPDQSE
jgi:hypothetical protein